jgi:hypothetical protein
MHIDQESASVACISELTDIVFWKGHESPKAGVFF